MKDINIGDEGLVPCCDGCAKVFFDMFSTCVLCVVVNGAGRVFLIKQSYGSDEYVGVAGYMKPGETAEQAAAREVSEELGIPPIRVEYLKSVWYEKKDMLMLGFLVHIPDLPPKLSGEVKSVSDFTFEEAKNAVRTGNAIWEMLVAAEERAERNDL